MKKSLLLFTIFTAAVAAQSSTCETRVDSHPKATTPQRVDYCLTTDPVVVPETDKPKVILSDVITKTPDTDESAQTASLEQKYYNNEDLFVRHKYVGSPRFPQFKNDIQSEREIKEQQEAQSVPAKKTATQNQPALVMNSSETQEKTSSAPVKNEQKPARTLKNTAQKESVGVAVPTEGQLQTEADRSETVASADEDWFTQTDNLYEGQ